MPQHAQSDEWEYWEVPPALKHKLRDIAREFRKAPTASENILWKALRNRQLEGRKFRRQFYIGPFILDFYCPQERLAVEIDGPIHQLQHEADQIRQELIEALGIRFVRVTDAQVERHLGHVLRVIREAFAVPRPPALPE